MSKISQLMKDARRRRVIPNAALYIVAAWVAIQVADLAIDAGYLRGLSLRNVWNAAFLGFPLALIASWFYDITRRGIVRTPPAAADASFDQSLHKRDYLLFAALAAVWIGANVFVHTPAPVEKSIAILPFENRGHDPQGADLAFGVRLDVQTQLEKLQDIKVIAQPSVENIQKDLPISQMAKDLGVAFIMKGTVERVLDRVRVSVTLVDAGRDEQAWSGSYDRQLDVGSLFDIRDDIAGAITDRLQAVLSPQELGRIQTRPTESFAAYQAYLLGRQRMARRATASLAEAVDYFQQAVELDPQFALAYVSLADSYYLRMVYGSLSEDEELPKIKTAVDTALELDDQLGEAYATLAAIESMTNDDAAVAEKAFKRALELNPNYATAHQWYGGFLANQDREEEGLAHRNKALELDPLSANINLVVGNALGDLGQFDEALAHYEKAIEIDPAIPGAYERIGEIYRYVFGRFDESVIWQRKGIALDPGEPMGSFFLALIYLDLGDTESAEYWLKRSVALFPPGFPSQMLMEPLYLRRGEADEALEIGRGSLQMNPGGVETIAHVRSREMAAGRFAEARVLYELGFPELLEDRDPVVDDSNLEPAIGLAEVLMHTGEQERAELLLDGALAVLPTMPRLGRDGYGIADVFIYAAQGETTKALSTLREAIDQGWRRYWWFYLEHDTNLDSIRDEPEFQAMVEEIKADMAAQLEHVRAMEASGELEPIPDVD